MEKRSHQKAAREDKTVWWHYFQILIITGKGPSDHEHSEEGTWKPRWVELVWLEITVRSIIMDGS